jgi:hypothetical protein
VLFPPWFLGFTCSCNSDMLHRSANRWHRHLLT